ncbi:MAG TPA: hypothetical protein VMT45_14075, partial [Thermoanaerobaculaceae bacterium]|nr:hypothetical protein [Thermoanaerobaculaceae bacterium]
GVFVTDQEAGTVKGLQDLHGATLVGSEEGAKYFHMYSPDFATDTAYAETLGPSPFITAIMRLGPEYEKRMRRIASFYGLLASDGPEFQRITRNFLLENWDHFGKGIGKYLDWPVEQPIDRQRALFQLLEIMLGGVFTSEGHVGLISTMYNELTSLLRSSRPQFIAFINEALVGGYLRDSRRALLELLLRFVERADDFRSVLPYWDPADLRSSFPPDLAVTAPRAFHELKSLYVDLYEAIARALTLVSGIANVQRRGNHNLYAPHPTLGKKFAPHSMAEFHRKSNAPKVAYLSDLPWLEAWLAPALDSKLRNAIGHNSSHYNPRTGTIDYRLDGTGSVRSISYGDFLFGILRLVRSALQMAHLIKQLYVFDHFRDVDVP